MSRAIALLLCVLVMPLAVLAQTLADKVSADTVFYVGFKGSDALTADYARSDLKGFLDGTDLDVLASDNFARGVSMLMKQENPEVARQIVPMMSSARQMWHYPTALIGYSDGMSILCDAGPGATQLMAQIRRALGKNPDAKLAQDGNLVTLSFGKVTSKKPFAPLSGDPSFQAAMKQVTATAPAVMFFNVKAMLDAMEHASANRPDPEVAKARLAFGLDGIHAVAASGAFDGKGWVTRVFVDAPTPRTGLAKLFESSRISPDLYRLVPATAASVSFAQFDFSAALDQVRGSLKAYDANDSAQFEQMLGMSPQFLQTDVAKELLPALGPDWAVYSDASIGSVHPLAYVCVNILRNPQQAEASLSKMQSALLALGNMAMTGQKMSLAATERQFGQTTVHTIALPIVAPSWAIRDGKLYLSLYPQLVVAAADFASSTNVKTFADNAMLAAMQKRLGVQASGVSYCDLPQLAINGYGNTMLLTHYAGFLDLFGVQSPTMMVPPLPEMQKHISPSMAISWTDAAGWHMQENSPFPGSGVLATTLSPDMSAMQGPLAISILLPSLSHAREKANQVKCANNMRQIGQGCLLYANDNIRKGAPYPPDLGALMIAEEMTADCFVCPSSNAAVPAELRTRTKEQQAKWVNENSPYVYCGKGLSSSSNPEFIVVYENTEDHGSTGCNVLFADGHVEFLNPDGFRKTVEECRKAGQQLPETAGEQ